MRADRQMDTEKLKGAIRHLFFANTSKNVRYALEVWCK
jgi:hypothetical protein